MWTTAVRVAGRAVAASVAVTAAAAGGVLVTLPAGVDGPSAALAELRGHTETTSRAQAAQTPRGAVPYWTRALGTDVTVVRPGEAHGEEDGSVRVDMALAAGTTPPASCTPAVHPGTPWDGGGSWPDLTAEPVLRCEDWATVVVDGHLYAWTAPPSARERPGPP